MDDKIPPLADYFLLCADPIAIFLYGDDDGARVS